MKIKVQLFDKKTEQEVSDILIMEKLQSEIDTTLKEKFNDYNFKIKIYGEIIPLRW